MNPSASSVLFVFLLAPFAEAQIQERVDLSNADVPGNMACVSAQVTNDGRFVAFESLASNFFAGDLSATRDVFLRDRRAGTTVHIVPPSPTTTESFGPVVTGDGRFVAFTALEFSGGTLIRRAIVHDRQANTTTAVTSGAFDAIVGAISSDGRFLALNARPGGVFGGVLQAYVLDRQTNAVTLASRTPAGLAGNGASSDPRVSDDGLKVVFASAATDLVPLDTNGNLDVFAFDVATATVTRESIGPHGEQGNGDSRAPSLSADGNVLAFQSAATNLVPDHAAAFEDVFVRDLSLQLSSVVSVATGKQLGNAPSSNPRISADGRKIAFQSLATNLVPDDNLAYGDVFVRDQDSEVTRRVSVGAHPADADVFSSSLSANGRFIGLISAATNLLAGPAATTTGGYLADLGPGCSASNYCTALPNSTGEPASILSSGDPSFALDNFTLACLYLPETTVGLFFSGTSAVDPGVPFGNGLLCVGGTIVRHGTVQVTDGVAIDGQSLRSSEYAGVHPGDKRYYQFWYRNVAAGGAGSNTSDALAVTFCY
jgi:Tol biopolymer transport system component